MPATDDIVVPLYLRCDEGELAFVSTVTTFGTPIDVMVSELPIELGSWLYRRWRDSRDALPLCQS